MGFFDRAKNALVGSAAEISIRERSQPSDPIRQKEIWQGKAWELYKNQGILHYPVNFIGQSLSRLRLVPAMEKDGSMDTKEENSKAKKLVEDLNRGAKNRGYEGHASLLNTLGVHLTLVGESYLIGTTQGGRNTWEIRSISEVVFSEGKAQLRRRPNGPREDLPEGTPIIRVWLPDPEWQDLPDSPIRPLLDLFEELQTLSDALAAIDKSRIPAGILKVPDELNFPGSTLEEGFETFVDELVGHLSEPIKDRKSAASLVPFAIMGKTEALKEFDLLKLERGSIQTDIQRMELLFRRVEMGLPLPPEVLKGKADLNHWTGWVISEDVWKAIQPIAVLILSALTHAYLRPGLEKMGMDADEARNWWIWFDPTDLIVQPDRTQIATDGVDRALLSGATWRRVAGFTEDDAPTPEEIAEKQAATAPGTSVDGRGAASSAPPPPPRGEPGPPKVEGITAAVAVDDLGKKLAEIDRELTMRLVLGAEEAVEQACSRFGARLRSKLNSTERQQMVNVDNAEIAAALGPTRIRELGFDDRAFMKESLSKFANRAATWAKLSEKQAQTLVADAIGDLGENALELAAHRDQQHFALQEFSEALIAQALERLYSPSRSVSVG